MNSTHAGEGASKVDEKTVGDNNRAIKIVVEIDEDNAVKVLSNYAYVDVEVVKWDDLKEDGTASLVEKAKEIAIKAPHQVYKEDA